MLKGDPRRIDPERDAGSIHPGRIRNAAGAYRVSACRETNTSRLPMGTRMVGAAVSRPGRRVGTKAAKNDSQNENPARRPDQRIGLPRSR